MPRFLCRSLLILCLMLPGLAPAGQLGELLNKPAPKADVELIDGTTLGVHALDGKVVLTVFWATWCPTCVKEMPKLQRLYETYHERGFEIVAISLDEHVKEVTDFLPKCGCTFPVGMRRGAIRRAWGVVPATPQLVLSDRKGVVRFDHLGRVDYEQLKAQLLQLL